MNYHIFWLRRDLRLEDNHALYEALSAGLPVQCLFIFDEEILHHLPEKDRRVSFIYKELSKLNAKLEQIGGTLWIKKGKLIEVWKALIKDKNIKAVYLNHDYEPYARKRDEKVQILLSEHCMAFHSFKDQVVFEKNEVLKSNGLPFQIYSPFMRAWKRKLHENLEFLREFKVELNAANILQQPKANIPSLKSIGFEEMPIPDVPQNLSEINIKDYDKKRDYPSQNGTSRLGTALRFGTISIRKAVKLAMQQNEVFLNELIWREFFAQILWHFPRVEKHSFKEKYDRIEWRNNETEFKKWCEGKTGYPMVDAGMRELNQTGYMHNRVRMITASFLTKHLLIDWRWGEAYFAEKLMDFDLASNNGNWQWAAGCGTDAAPYFRIFNPMTQLEKFDKSKTYIKKWIPELDTLEYPPPVVEHKKARERALQAYVKSIR